MATVLLEVVLAVGNHITSIFAKLQVTTRAEAIVRASTSGLSGN